MRQYGKPPRQTAGGLSFLQRGDQVDQGAVVDAATALRSRNRQADGQVRLADARRTEQYHVLLAIDEVELAQAFDLFALDRRLERELKGLQCLDHRQPRGAHRGLQPSVIAQSDLRRQKPADRVRGGDATAVDLAKDPIHGFQRAWHLQIGQHAANGIALRAGRDAHRATRTRRSYAASERRSTVSAGYDGLSAVDTVGAKIKD